MKTNLFPDKRRGTILVLVVGILAVLMLMGVTIAVMTRTETQTSQYYARGNQMDTVTRALRNYTRHLLLEDRFGQDGYPTNYDRLEDHMGHTDIDWQPGDPYPTGAARAAQDADGNYVLNGDDENFDSFQTEEWLYNRQGTDEEWRLFSGPDNNAALYDTSEDGEIDSDDNQIARWRKLGNVLEERDYGALFEPGAEIRFAIRIFDMGGARLNVNRAGHYDGGNPQQNQGLSAAEVNPEPVVEAMGGAGADASDLLYGNDSVGVEGRWGPDDAPAFGGDDPGLAEENDLLDYNADGTVDEGSSDYTDDPTEFFPRFPEEDVDDKPFGTPDLNDFFWYWDDISKSRAAALMTDPDGWGLGGLTDFETPSGAPLGFTTASPVRLLVGRSLSETAWVSTDAQNYYGNENASDFWANYQGVDDPIDWPERTAGGSPRIVPLYRPMQSLPAGGSDSTEEAGYLYDMLTALGGAWFDLKPDTGSEGGPGEVGPPPWANPGGGNGSGTPPGLTGPTNEMILRQIAVNLVDMMDEDNDVTTWQPGGSGPTYRGVEPTPYIAEVEAAINTQWTEDSSTNAFVPYSGEAGSTEGELPEPGERQRYGPYHYVDQDETGSYTNEEPLWINNGGDKYYDPKQGDVEIVSPAPESDSDDSATNDEGDPYPVEDYSSEDEPATGWGKYIKLVNPWNVPLNLDNYTLRIPYEYDGDGHRLRKWMFDPAEGTWTEEPYEQEITVDLSGWIPPRGHFLVVDTARAFEKLDADHDDVQEKKELHHLHDLDGDSANPPVVELERDQDGETITLMRVELPDTGELDSDDPDSDSSSKSVQIDSDPRPCVRNIGDAGTTPSIDVPMTDVPADQTLKYSAVGDPTAYEWFNYTWKSDSAPLERGDGWSKMAATDDLSSILYSFPPVVEPDSVGDASDDIEDSNMEAYTGVGGDETRVMNAGKLPNMGALSFAHAGVQWTTLSLSYQKFGAPDMVTIRGLPNYIVSPSSPFEDEFDNDGDGDIDANDTGDPGGLEDWRAGRVNVNTAPRAVLKSALKGSLLAAMAFDADSIADAIVSRREEQGPYTSIQDLFIRVPELFGYDYDGDTDNLDGSIKNTYRRQAMARFVSNLVTVRTDVWGVVARVQVYDGNDYGVDADIPDEDVLAERRFYYVLDRSGEPIRLLLQRILSE